MSKNIEKNALRLKRKKRVRSKVEGTSERPRLSVFRSSKHIFAQVIDDLTGKTLVSIGSFNKGKAERADKEVCTKLGKDLAQKCLANKIDKVVFDKNGYAYHGRIKALADGAREGGLNF